MDQLAAARSQMALSLGFHMIFAASGIAMPLLMLMAEGLWLRTGKRHYRDLAHKWAKATGLLFAIGAVSGTALSFELGLALVSLSSLQSKAALRVGFISRIPAAR